MKKQVSIIRIIEDSDKLSLVDLNSLKGGTKSAGCTKCKGGSNNCNVHDKQTSSISAF